MDKMTIASYEVAGMEERIRDMLGGGMLFGLLGGIHLVVGGLTAIMVCGPPSQLQNLAGYLILALLLLEILVGVLVKRIWAFLMLAIGANILARCCIWACRDGCPVIAIIGSVQFLLAAAGLFGALVSHPLRWIRRIL